MKFRSREEVGNQILILLKDNKERLLSQIARKVQSHDSIVKEILLDLVGKELVLVELKRLPTASHSRKFHNTHQFYKISLKGYTYLNTVYSSI